MIDGLLKVNIFWLVLVDIDVGFVDFVDQSLKFFFLVLFVSFWMISMLSNRFFLIKVETFCFLSSICL